MPTRGGVKDFRPDGSDRQSNKLEAFHEASRVLFTEEHVANKSVPVALELRWSTLQWHVFVRKSLSIAEWKDDKGYAEVKIAKVAYLLRNHFRNLAMCCTFM